MKVSSLGHSNGMFLVRNDLPIVTIGNLYTFGTNFDKFKLSHKIHIHTVISGRHSENIRDSGLRKFLEVCLFF